MATENTTNNNEKKSGHACFGCTPENFKEIFEKMAGCWTDKESPACCQGAMEKTIKEMMKMCWETKPDA